MSKLLQAEIALENYIAYLIAALTKIKNSSRSDKVKYSEDLLKCYQTMPEIRRKIMMLQNLEE